MAESPEVPGAGCEVLDPDTPVVGGVVVAPGPVPGAHGTAVPLVPVGAGALAVAPVLRAVVLTESVGVGLALAVLVAPDEARLGLLDGVAAADAAVSPLLDADVDTEPDCARGPASAAVFTLPLDDVVVPVELFAWLDGDVAVPLALAEAGAESRVAEADAPTPVTGTQGVVMGVAAGEVALGWVVPELPDVPGFCAANAPTDRAATKAALLVIIANRFFTEPFLSLTLRLEVHSACPWLNLAISLSKRD